MQINNARSFDPLWENAELRRLPGGIRFHQWINRPRSTAMKNVGLVGFEPTASASRTQRSTKLSHSPNFLATHPPVTGPVVAQRPYFAHFARAGK
jgi:hypothetical protein